MADREDNVYKAKLTEQAERYDGNCAQPYFQSLQWHRHPIKCGLQICGIHNG